MIKALENQSVRVVGYCRASTTEQSVSLADQEKKLRAYCDLSDLDIVDAVRAHESAMTLKRDGLRRALAMLESGQADAHLVLKLDRLSHSLHDLLTLVDRYFSPTAKSLSQNLTVPPEDVSAGEMHEAEVIAVFFHPPHEQAAIAIEPRGGAHLPEDISSKLNYRDGNRALDRRQRSGVKQLSVGPGT